MEEINVGDMIKFDRINGHTPEVNDRIGLYLGEDFIHRPDGMVVENHKVLLLGDTQPRLIDRSLLKYIKKYDKNA